RTVTGFAKVEAALTRVDRVAALIHAAEAAGGGMGKLTAGVGQRPDAEKITNITIFSSSQFDFAFGRANVVHAVLVAGPETEAFLARLARLERFRTGTR